MHNIKKMIENRRNREVVYSRADYWDEKAVQLAGDAVSMWPNNHLNELYGKEHYAIVEAWFQNVDGLRVLDIGCGTGRMSRYFARRGARVSGLDFSSKAIDLARFQTAGDNPLYRVGSVFDLMDEGIYDIALCWGVLTVACTNRERLDDALCRIRHALKPGGTLVLVEPIHKGFLHRVLAMNLESFTEVMTGVGFDVQKIQSLHFWPARLVLAYVPWPKWITHPIYWIGQRLMQRFNNSNSGDYKAIYAVSR
jgi:2-polyprenyl-3-methyl-5-hydroxy-6-metoxy-1,4-benzoquinol methylase